MAYRLMAFLPEKEFDFESLVKEIKEVFSPDKKVKISTQDQSLIKFIWPDFQLMVEFEQNPNREELSEIVDSYATNHPEKDKITDAKTVIWVESSQDPEMDHFNDYVIVSQVIDKIPGIILWDPQSYNFIDPETSEQKKYY